MSRFHRPFQAESWLVGLTLAACMTHGAAAAPSGAAALVVGVSHYDGKPAAEGCGPAALAAGDRLRRLGFAVTEAIDGTGVSLRAALGEFSARAASGTAPALVYVCAAATAVDTRVFVLPGDVDLQEPLRPETQGVVLRALLNAIAPTKGTLVAELTLPPGTPADPVAAAIRASLPGGTRLALVLSDGSQAGALGNRLADNATPAADSWDRFAMALEAAEPNLPGAVAVFEPPPPRPVPNPAPANIGQPAAAAPPPIALAPPPPQIVPPADAPPSAPDADAPPAADAAKQNVDPKAAKPRPAPDDRVKRVQAALKARKFYFGPLDGVLDSRVIQAIVSFQLSIGSKPTGTLTQTEIVRLLNNW
jgi:hypothetical protein